MEVSSLPVSGLLESPSTGGGGGGRRFRFRYIRFGRLVRHLDQGRVDVSRRLGSSVQEHVGCGIGCRVRQCHRVVDGALGAGGLQIGAGQVYTGGSGIGHTQAEEVKDIIPTARCLPALGYRGLRWHHRWRGFRQCIQPGRRVGAPAVVVLHLAQAVALGVPDVGRLVQLFSAQAVLIQLDDLVADIVAVPSGLVVGVLFVDLVTVGVVLVQSDTAVKILHLDDLDIGVIPVVRLAAVRVSSLSEPIRA